MYQGLGQMLTKCLQHHQGYPETPKSADVICEWPLTNRVDGKYCDFEALSQDRNLAVMKWADVLNKDVTCYNNDNHDHKIIIEQSMLLMIAASEPDKRYPNSEF